MEFMLVRRAMPKKADKCQAAEKQLLLCCGCFACETVKQKSVQYYAVESAVFIYCIRLESAVAHH